MNSFIHDAIVKASADKDQSKVNTLGPFCLIL